MGIHSSFRFGCVGVVSRLKQQIRGARLYRSCIVTRVRSSSDGLIRLSSKELRSVSLTHLISGVDAEICSKMNSCGRITSLSGYTEWVGATNPIISIGWDWCIEPTTCKLPLWKRASLPRSNIMLVSEADRDMTWTNNLEILAEVIDALAWQELVAQAVATRYS